MSALRQRHPRQRDETHLAYVRMQPCCVCGSLRDVEAAHLKLRKNEIGKEPPGMQEKADDRWVTPLCHYHHQSSILAQHKVGEQRFWFEIHGRNPFEIADRLWKESGGEARAVAGTIFKRPKKIKERKPAEQRKKVAQGRPLQSNPTIAGRGFPTADRQHTATRPVEKGFSQLKARESDTGRHVGREA